MPSRNRTRALKVFNFVSAFKRAPLSLGRGYLDYCHRLLIDQMADWPVFKAQAAVVFGAAEVSGTLARHMAELVATGKLADNAVIYFTGGVEPLKKAAKNGTMDLIEMQTQITEIQPEPGESRQDPYKVGGLSAPKEGEREGPYMERVFWEELRKILKARKRDHAPIRFTVETSDNPKDTDTQKNITEALRMGAGKHDNLLLVSMPQHARRAMSTWRRSAGYKAILQPAMVWPLEIGITAWNWRKKPIAERIAYDEGIKIIYPTPSTADYVFNKPYAYELNLKIEKGDALYLQKHPKATTRPRRKRALQATARPSI